jgi:hypothetical protein
VNSLWQWLGTGALAAIISALISWPKSRGEGKQAEGAGTKAVTEAQIALQQSTLREARDSAAAAHASAREANEARDQCQAQIRKIRGDFEAFADVIEELVPLLPPGESQRKARVAIRAARLAI